MTKSKLGLGMTIMMVVTTVTYADLYSLAETVAKETIVAAKEVAMKDNTKTTISNSTLVSEVDIENAAVIGNGGVLVTGDTVNISDSTLDASLEVERAVIIGNGGIKVGN